ncbi:hypothetical protein LTR94_032587, partial [Friedmanniomyces endolithicus]
MGWFQQILAFGWRCRPLGLPQVVDGAMLAALRIDIAPGTPGLLAAAGIQATPAIRLDDEITRSARDLLDHGWCVLPDALPPAQIHALDDELAGDFAATPFGQGGFYGSSTKRFGRLLMRAAAAAALVQHPRILGIVEAVLAPWC